MAAPTFEDKEDIRETTLPRKNTVVADDINQLKNGIVDLYENPPVVTPTLTQVLNTSNESQTQIKIVGTGTSASLIRTSGVQVLDSSGNQTAFMEASTGNVTASKFETPNGIVQPYKVYVAKLAIDGSDNITVVAEYSEIGAVSWDVEDGGKYNAISADDGFAGALIETFVSGGIEQVGSEALFDFVKRTNAVIQMNVYNTSMANTSGFEGTVRIHVWPTITP